jgi:hypothetical protein
MPFSLQAIDPAAHPNLVPYRVVPVRFARAVSGFVDDDAPDLDDHGFIAADEYGPNHGPTMALKRGSTRAGAVQPGPTVRVKVVRDRIEASAQLFPVIADTSIAELVFPAAGTALSPTDTPASGSDPARVGDNVYVRSTSTGRGSVETKLSLHCGAVDGPKMAEMTLRVHPMLYIPVVAHRVAIGGTAAPATTIGTLRTLFNKVNQIYAQAGIHFTLDGTVRAETINPYNMHGLSVPFAQAGLVTTYTEIQMVLTVNPVADSLNAYFFPDYAATDAAGNAAAVAGTWGWATSRAGRNNIVLNPAGTPIGQPGITFRDPTGLNMDVMGWTIAHEIGHCLTLEHYNNGQQPTTVRHDIWAHRNLMHNFVDLNPNTFPAANRYPSSSERIKVGYGSAMGLVRPGSGLMIKKRTGRIFQSDQANVLRRAALNGSYKTF